MEITRKRIAPSWSYEILQFGEKGFRGEITDGAVHIFGPHWRHGLAVNPDDIAAMGKMLLALAEQLRAENDQQALS